MPITYEGRATYEDGRFGIVVARYNDSITRHVGTIYANQGLVSGCGPTLM